MLISFITLFICKLICFTLLILCHNSIIKERETDRSSPYHITHCPACVCVCYTIRLPQKIDDLLHTLRLQLIFGLITVADR